MSNWVCYLISSFHHNLTYVGSTNNFEKRLSAHNNQDTGKKRVGAKYTKGKTWYPVLIVKGFESKNECLSFESGWKRLSRTRNQSRLAALESLISMKLRYTKNTIWNRIIDLLYFVHYTTCLRKKFIYNKALKFPYLKPGTLRIANFSDYGLEDFPFPYFVEIES